MEKKFLKSLGAVPARITPNGAGLYRFLTRRGRRIHLIIGLTGGSGTGKTTAAKILQKLGMEGIDVDRIAHSFLVPGSPVYEEIIAAFGEEFRKAEGIDRKNLGKIVFTSLTQKRKLENIVHPLLKEEVTRVVQTARQKGKDLVLDYPLLFEMRMEDLVDEVWVVAVPPKLQAARIIKRDKLTPKEAEARIAAQLPLKEKVARAGVVIDNTGSLQELESKVTRLWEERVKCRRQQH